MSVGAYPTDTAFAQIGNDHWIPDGFDLDRLLITKQGPKSALAAYIASLTMWDPASADANMYLSGWTVDDDPVSPSVTLNYSGKKGGIASSTKHDSGSSLDNVAGWRPPLVPDLIYGNAYTVTYYAKTTEAKWISTSDITGAPPDMANEPQPIGNADIRQLRITYPTPGAAVLLTSGGARDYIINFIFPVTFGQVTDSLTTCEEVVSGRYWACRQIKTKRFVPYYAS